MGAAWSKLEENETWSKLPKWVKFGVVNVAAHVIAFWGPNVFLHLFVYGNPRYQSYKIHSSVPPPALVTAAVKDNIGKTFVGFPVIAWPFYKFMALGGQTTEDKIFPTSPSKQCVDNSKIDSKTEKGEGWSCLSFGKSNVPSWVTMGWQVFVAYLLYDMMFYFSHRALHSKALYKSYHKQHHEFTASVGVASSYEGTVEGMVQMLNWFVPLGIVGSLNGNLHISTVFAYNCLRWLETVDAHCGYIFPWSPFHFIPLFGGALAHDFHHSGNGLQMKRLADGTLFADFGNYGATVIWDKLIGTVSPAFVEYSRRILQR